ncbi:MAG: hypothetical protein F4X57_08055 [Chloroflexi bacterium]|nr:hypothetical protein [Chloroflexota bacterium]
MENRNRLWIMLGGGAVAVVIAVAVIAVVALNLTGGDSSGAPTAATEFPAHAHILGDANAPVTVVEYGDFQ